MRVIVCGSRTFPTPRLIAERMAKLPLDTTVVHGAAAGPDRWASYEALALGLRVEAHPADWDRHGRSAGYIRNNQMAVMGADLCIAFWDGESKGTQHMITLAEAAGIPVEIIRPEE